jgi:hypothetical protein
MPAGVTGREAKIAFEKFGTNSWHVAASVTKGVYFASTGGMRLQPARVNDEAFGQTYLGRGDLGEVTAPDVTLTGRARYDDWQFVLDALAMGSPATATLSNSASGQTASYSHVIDLATTNNGLGATFAVDKSLYVDELTSGKIYGFSEAVGDGGVMDKSYKVLGSKMTNISSVNIAATVSGASFPALSDRVFRHQGTLRMNVQSAGSLVAADAVQAETIEFTFERPQDAPFIFSQDYIAEPADSGFPTVRMTVNYPRMTATSASSIYAALRTNPVFKGDLTFVGAYINSTDQYRRMYQFPALELDEWNGADVEGAQQVKPTATITAKLALTAPTGMSGITRPFRLTLINTKSAAAF